MYSDYLVPFDGSAASFRAVETAIEVGCTCGYVQITVLTVRKINDSDLTNYDVAARLAGFAVSSDGRVHQATQSEEGQSSVQEFFDSLPENIDVKIVVKRGNPSDVICEYARDNDIDCIVMGRRGLGGIRAVLGSVSSAVLRDSDLPILVVK